MTMELRLCCKAVLCLSFSSTVLQRPHIGCCMFSVVNPSEDVASQKGSDETRNIFEDSLGPVALDGRDISVRNGCFLARQYMIYLGICIMGNLY